MSTDKALNPLCEHINERGDGVGETYFVVITPVAMYVSLDDATWDYGWDDKTLAHQQYAIDGISLVAKENGSLLLLMRAGALIGKYAGSLEYVFTKSDEALACAYEKEDVMHGWPWRVIRLDSRPLDPLMIN